MTRAPITDPVATRGVQRLPGALSAFETMHEVLLRNLVPVSPESLRVMEAEGCVLAQAPAGSAPEGVLAMRDGWACRAETLAGASAYAPVMPEVQPVWIEVGDVLPEGCDCVIAADAVEPLGARLQIVAEAFPGENARQAQEDFPPGWAEALVGKRLGAVALGLLTTAGVTQVMVRRPRALLFDPRPGVSAQLLQKLMAQEGAAVTIRAEGPIDPTGFDLIVTVGGTGEGHGDHTIRNLAEMGVRTQHGLALNPIRSAAVSGSESIPAISLPGRPEQALAGFLALVKPLLARLSQRALPTALEKPLARKIASAVGLAELVLLRLEGETFQPLAVGDLPLHNFVEATHWCILPAASEGLPVGALLAAEPLGNLV